MDQNINFEGNEHRPLLGSNLDDSVPWSEDDRWWIRIPVRQWLFLGGIGQRLIHSFKRDYTHAFLIFVPIGLFTDSLCVENYWKLGLNCIALLALQSTFISTAESTWLFSSQTVANVLTEMLPNVFPILVGVVCITNGYIMSAQYFTIGVLITHLLVGPGCCFLIGGIRHSERHINSATAITMSQLILMISAPFIVSSALSFSIYYANDYERRVYFLAYASSAILLAFQLIWLIFKYKTHTYLFQPFTETEEDGASSGRSTIFENVDMSPQSRAAYILWLAMVLVFAIKCTDSLLSINGLLYGVPFFYGVLLPLSISAPGIIKTYHLAKAGQMDLVIHLTVDTAIGLSFFTLPILILFSANIAMTISNFTIFMNVLLFMTVLTVARIIKDGIINYLKGCMCLALYLIIAIALYLYPGSVGDLL
ncbi:hypothetical protein ASPSYDRAFT_46028 [Aspergillus sydowii CBS 593.65]|uniref:Sodium/calcium exchanger membrane region domain-containing protein n=1 Tax=Aspergillus sydowii CBS 593.65 TaxID=1036612 RepID=A0A1L9TF56_9EURO|nr:uncharacterized protein ASPSYDRAFT_46028 [Aspergillus sydowii CBS 593.65]OJJ58042.1 hypothetical protein ASPSYDRAFT_46028 [Aspergillus sydowii CBS 593.65]